MEKHLNAQKPCYQIDSSDEQQFDRRVQYLLEKLADSHSMARIIKNKKKGKIHGLQISEESAKIQLQDNIQLCRSIWVDLIIALQENTHGVQHMSDRKYFQTLDLLNDEIQGLNHIDLAIHTIDDEIQKENTHSEKLSQDSLENLTKKVDAMKKEVELLSGRVIFPNDTTKKKSRVSRIMGRGNSKQSSSQGSCGSVQFARYPLAEMDLIPEEENNLSELQGEIKQSFIESNSDSEQSNLSKMKCIVDDISNQIDAISISHSINESKLISILSQNQN